ncbi:MAG: HIRAN domain-containing protein [Oscillospiraceae bacterium]|nr:HIRAN domain-containing protein [Oscillospiraceae bacterium]
MYEKSRNLLDFHIAGFTYYDGLDVIEQLTLGTSVSLKSEPDNPYDPEAIVVMLGETKLGYVPKVKNDLLSTLLYFGYNDVVESKIIGRDLEAHPERQFRVVVKVKDKRKC